MRYRGHMLYFRNRRIRALFPDKQRVLGCFIVTCRSSGWRRRWRRRTSDQTVVEEAAVGQVIAQIFDSDNLGHRHADAGAVTSDLVECKAKLLV
jgi:hypothetical protein